MEKNSYADLRVAILTNNLKVGQDISSSLRLYGVFAFFYQKLSDLWQLLSSEELDLVLIDIRQTEELGLFLKDHPIFKDTLRRKCYVGVFYQEKYQSLFGVCKPLNPLSIINVEHALATPIKSLLQMVLGQRQLERKVNSCENRIRVLEEKLILSEMNSESLKNNLSKMIRVAEVVKKFQRRKMSDKNSFMEMLSSFFDSWKFVHSFSLVTLNGANQKIYSPELMGHKHKQLPLMFLNEEQIHGITPILRQAILPKAYDLLGVNVVVLDVHGVRDYPEVLLFLQVGDEKLKSVEDGYHWIMLENILSNLFKSSMISERESLRNKEQEISVGQALELIDESAELKIDQGFRVLNINFTELVAFITARPMFLFHWKSFYFDFISGLKSKLVGEYKYSFLGPEHLLFFIPPIQFEVNFAGMKEYLQKFEYFNYFNDSTILIPGKMIPTVQLIAADSNHYLRRYILDSTFLPMQHQSFGAAKLGGHEISL